MADRAHSIKPGTTAATRAVASGAATLAPTSGAPGTATPPQASVKMAQYLSVFGVTDAGTANLQVWWWCDEAEHYWKDNTIAKIAVTADGAGINLTVPPAANGVLIQLMDYAGGCTTVTAWVFERGAISP